jgi:hypothetical protein
MRPRTRWTLLAFPLVALLAAASFVPRLLEPAPPPPDYTLVEPGLYIGSHTEVAPPDAVATLNLCENPDAYRTPVYQWSPIPDAPPAPPMHWLREQVDFIAKERAAGHTVYVHCNAGKSRSGMVVAAYLMQEHHLPRDQALVRIRDKRPVVHPIGPFMQLLDDWQAAMN